MIKLIGILKYHDETFTHGIAPISYQWNTSNPGVLSLNYPSKSDLTSGVVSSGATHSFVMTTKKVRDNRANNNAAIFAS